MRLRATLWPIAGALLLSAAAVLPARAEHGADRSGLIRLQADSDEGILLAQAIKDWLVSDLGSQRVFRSVKYLVVQDWVRERGFDQLDARQRKLYRDPSRYDAPLVQLILVTVPAARERPAEAIFTWAVPLRLWDDLSREVSGLAADLGKTFASAHERPMRILFRFGDAEVLRLAATPDGRAATIFSYR